MLVYFLLTIGLTPQRETTFCSVDWSILRYPVYERIPRDTRVAGIRYNDFAFHNIYLT